MIFPLLELSEAVDRLNVLARFDIEEYVAYLLYLNF